MTEWMMTHPWMTFFLAAMALLVLDNIICALTRALGRRQHRRMTGMDRDTPRASTGWVSVKERLPLENETVLVVVSGEPRSNLTMIDVYEFACYSSEYGWIMEHYPEWETPTVTHWMPLLEPPDA